MNPIPILDLNPEIEAHLSEFTEAFQRVLKTTHFIMGPEVKAFEVEIADYLGVKHAIGLNSGTDALIIGLRALGIGTGDEVICPSFTFFATAEAVSAVGATPVFLDIDRVTFNIDPALIEAKVTDRTKALIPVHLFGHAADMDPILALAERKGLRVMEDAAQAMGGEYHGKKVGTMGDVGTYSFYPSKNLGGFGDGGLVVTNDDKLAESCRMLRAHGSKKKYFNEVIGYNSRLDEVQAACLRVKLRYLEKSNEGRRQVARRYTEAFKGFSPVVVPTEVAPAKHVFHQYTIGVKGGKRDKLQAELEAQGISTMIYYPVPLHRLPVYAGMKVTLPETEHASTEVISLPIWPEMDVQTQLRVVDAVKKALS